MGVRKWGWGPGKAGTGSGERDLLVTWGPVAGEVSEPSLLGSHTSLPPNRQDGEVRSRVGGWKPRCLGLLGSGVQRVGAGGNGETGHLDSLKGELGARGLEKGELDARTPGLSGGLDQWGAEDETPGFSGRGVELEGQSRACCEPRCLGSLQLWEGWGLFHFTSTTKYSAELRPSHSRALLLPVSISAHGNIFWLHLTTWDSQRCQVQNPFMQHPLQAQPMSLKSFPLPNQYRTLQAPCHCLTLLAAETQAFGQKNPLHPFWMPMLLPNMPGSLQKKSKNCLQKSCFGLEFKFRGTKPRYPAQTGA